MTDLELLEDTFNKLGVEYHKLSSPKDPNYVYIQKMGAHDTTGHIWVSEQQGLVPLTDPSQLRDFFEFYEGDIASW